MFCYVYNSWFKYETFLIFETASKAAKSVAKLKSKTKKILKNLKLNFYFVL